MLSIEVCRKHLGDEGEEMGEEDIKELEELLYQLAHTMIEHNEEGEE